MVSLPVSRAIKPVGEDLAVLTGDFLNEVREDSGVSQVRRGVPGGRPSGSRCNSPFSDFSTYFFDAMVHTS